MKDKETTYAQEVIERRILEKKEWEDKFQDYSECTIILKRSEYGDYSHGDYSDYCRIH